MDDESLPDKSEYIKCGDKLDILPCNMNLAVTEINLRDEAGRSADAELLAHATGMGGEHTLSALLEPLRADYNYILIDTNPYLGLLTINALAACDDVIIPVSPQF
jgi:chromosome partitioning protein